MTRLTDESINTFRAGFGGQALTADHADYHRSRAVWNGAIDRKPALLACCTTAAQVADAIGFIPGAVPASPIYENQIRRV